jgi:hypothetical protein
VSEVRICSDSQSAIRALAEGPYAADGVLLDEIWRSLRCRAPPHWRFNFQWVPAHVGVPGNEVADRLAGEASSLPQQDVAIDLATARAAVNRAARGLPREPHHTLTRIKSLPRPNYAGMDRRAQTTIAQLRAGASPLTRDYLHRIGKAADDRCIACGAPDSVPHFLRCPGYSGLRWTIWGYIEVSEATMLSDPSKIMKYVVASARDSGPAAVPV